MKKYEVDFAIKVLQTVYERVSELKHGALSRR